MVIMVLIYIILFIVVAVVGYTFIQIKLYGMSIKDFWNFVKSIQDLDVLYNMSKQYGKMSEFEQIIFLSEAEKLFKVFEKVPSQVWEDEYHKYSYVVDVYKNIRMLRWASANL